MVKRIISLSVATVALALSAVASPLKLYPTGTGANPANAGKATVESWLSDQIDFYNTANNPDLPTSHLQQIRVEDPAISLGGAAGNEFTLGGLSGYEYIVFHWGGQGNAGGHPQNPKPNGPAYEAYYIDGVTSFTFMKPDNVGGLSWWAGYGIHMPPSRVPESASSLGLAALAFAAIGFLRRRT